MDALATSSMDDSDVRSFMNVATNPTTVNANTGAVWGDYMDEARNAEAEANLDAMACGGGHAAKEMM